MPGGHIYIDSMRRGLYAVTLTALFIFFCSQASAFELGNDTTELPGILLAQQFQDSTGQMQDTPRGDILKQAGEDQDAESEEEYDEEYDDEEDEYDDDEVELIADPMIGGNAANAAIGGNR